MCLGLAVPRPGSQVPRRTDTFAHLAGAPLGLQAWREVGPGSCTGARPRAPGPVCALPAPGGLPATRRGVWPPGLVQAPAPKAAMIPKAAGFGRPDPAPVRERGKLIY